MGVSVCQSIATAWAEMLCLIAIKCLHLDGFVLSLSLCWIKISWGLSKMSMDMGCFKIALELEFFLESGSMGTEVSSVVTLD